jgi:hypothetical protein
MRRNGERARLLILHWGAGRTTGNQRESSCDASGQDDWAEAKAVFHGESLLLGYLYRLKMDCLRKIDTRKKAALRRLVVRWVRSLIPAPFGLPTPPATG